MAPRVAVVTGGNKGIGLAVVRGLCRRFDGDVFLTARDAARGEAAVEQLRQEGLNVKFHQLDIGSQESLDVFKRYIEEHYNGLDVLVNNAAIAFKNDDPTPFGVQAEQTIHTNYIRLVATCNTLFPLLRPHARVVNLSSSLGHLSKIPSKELRAQLSSPSLTETQLTEIIQSFVRAAKDGTHSKAGWPNSTYAVSKVGVSALSFIQQKAFNNDSREDIVVNAVHPGWVITDMSSHTGLLTPEQGADAPLFCALLPPNVTAPRGAYVWWNKRIVDWTGPTTPSENE
ncbi:WW domain-containing oxidoreductase [Gryllus bimaculatus]|nr:WW domain-containing oxidoreductase [Gryllus bimaculatus]